MEHGIREYHAIDIKIQNKIYDFIKNDSTELESSQLYSNIVKKKYVDTEKRSSKYKTIINKNCFDFMSELVIELNKLDDKDDFMLVQNDVTYIKYQEGDFFKPHEDYLSITSNFLEEYTLIICMDANCEGGETLFNVNNYHSYKSSSSKTRDHCLVFRKDINHEGTKIESGYKEIITVNLWGQRKNSPNIGSVGLAS